MCIRKRGFWRLAMAAATVVLVLVLLVAFYFRPGIRVTIKNAGTAPLQSVVLRVTGGTYDLGEIAPGASAAARVRPAGESHLEIEFIGLDGQIRRLDAGGYFEARYRGTIQVSIKNGVIDKNEQDIKLW